MAKSFKWLKRPILSALILGGVGALISLGLSAAGGG
jgi:hypothetical protein